MCAQNVTSAGADRQLLRPEPRRRPQPAIAASNSHVFVRGLLWRLAHTTCICSPVSDPPSGKQARELVLFSRVSAASAACIFCSSPVVHALRAASALGVSLGLSGGVELPRGRVAPTVTDGRVLSALLKQARAVLGSQESWQDF